MSSDGRLSLPRGVVGVILAGALAAAALPHAGCRNLVQPDPPPPRPIPVRGVVRDPEGLPMWKADVRVTDRRFVRFPEVPFAWNGETDQSGVFELEVPRRGPFDVEVRPPFGSRFPDFVFESVSFATTLTTLAYDLEPVSGRVDLPPPFDPDPDGPSSIGFTYRSAQGVIREIGAILLPDGRFDAWVHPGAYRARLSAWGVDDARVVYIWPDSVRADPDSFLTLDVPLVEYQADLLLGGRRDLLMTCEARTVDDFDHYTEVRAVLGTGPVTLWGFEGPSELEVQPRQYAPFMTRSVYLDVREGATIAFDLGPHRLEVRVVNAGGQPWLAASVEVTGELGRRELPVDAEGIARFYLVGGVYQVEAEIADRRAITAVTLGGDEVIQIVIP